MLTGYPASYTTGPRHYNHDDAPPVFLPPYQPGTPEEEEELALLQRLERGQTAGAGDTHAYMPPTKRGLPEPGWEEPQESSSIRTWASWPGTENLEPAGAGAEKTLSRFDPPAFRHEDERAGLGGQETAIKAFGMQEQRSGHSASDFSWPASDGEEEYPGTPGNAAAQGFQGRDLPTVPLDSVEAESRQPAFHGESSAGQLRKPGDWRGSGSPRWTPHARLTARQGRPAPDHSPPMADKLRAEGPPSAVPARGSQAGSAAQPAGAPSQPPAPQSAGAASAPSVSGNAGSSPHTAWLEEKPSQQGRYWELKINPPQNNDDARKLMEEERKNSPTSDATIAHLESLCGDEYELRWEVQTDKPVPGRRIQGRAGHAGFEFGADPATGKKFIRIIVSRENVNGGTFGHEADHVIKELSKKAKMAQRMKEGKPVDNNFMKNEWDAAGRNSVFPNAFDDEAGNSDRGEYDAMRTGNVITAERLINLMLDQQGISYAQRLQMYDPETPPPAGARPVPKRSIAEDLSVQYNTITGQSNTTKDMPENRKFGDARFKRLFDWWRKKAAEEAAAGARR